jgi:hypothetical protein
MCNCMKELEQKFIEKLGYEEADAPVEMLSGRAYLSFTVREEGKKKTKLIPMMLSKCPICGQEYGKTETPGAATPRESR